jgi:hypothetical protein
MAKQHSQQCKQQTIPRTRLVNKHAQDTPLAQIGAIDSEKSTILFGLHTDELLS